MAGKGGSLPKHGEPKKQRGIYTTTESWNNLDKIANEFMLSKSELIEMIGQGRLKVISVPEGHYVTVKKTLEVHMNPTVEDEPSDVNRKVYKVSTR